MSPLRHLFGRNPRAFRLYSPLVITGPTIQVDKEILDQTENPILSELRRQRKERGVSRNTELDDIRDKISQSRRKLAQLKKKRYLYCVITRQGSGCRDYIEFCDLCCLFEGGKGCAHGETEI